MSTNLPDGHFHPEWQQPFLLLLFINVENKPLMFFKEGNIAPQKASKGNDSFCNRVFYILYDHPNRNFCLYIILMPLHHTIN